MPCHVNSWLRQGCLESCTLRRGLHGVVGDHQLYIVCSFVLAWGLLTDLPSDLPPCFLQAHQVVVDLAAATLSMLSQRPPAHEVMATAGTPTATTVPSCHRLTQNMVLQHPHAHVSLCNTPLAAVPPTNKSQLSAMLQLKHARSTPCLCNLTASLCCSVLSCRCRSRTAAAA